MPQYLASRNANLTTETPQSIHENALAAAERYRKSEGRIIAAIASVDRARVYLALGHPSLFNYVTRELKLSESVACNAIAVTRKCHKIPELAALIENGDLGISKARKILPILTSKNQREWLGKAVTLSTRALEKEVARAFPRLPRPEKVNYISEKRLEITLSVDEALMSDLRRVQDQVSRSQARPATLEDTLKVLTQFYLSKKDRVQKAKRVITKKGGPTAAPTPAKDNAHASVTGQTDRGSHPLPRGEVLLSREKSPNENRRTLIPAAIQNAVRLRDLDRCQYPLSKDQRCQEGRWVHLHHIIPVNKGGTHAVSNITTLCEGHHRMVHRSDPISDQPANERQEPRA